MLNTSHSQTFTVWSLFDLVILHLTEIDELMSLNPTKPGILLCGTMFFVNLKWKVPRNKNKTLVKRVVSQVSCRSFRRKDRFTTFGLRLFFSSWRTVWINCWKRCARRTPSWPTSGPRATSGAQWSNCWRTPTTRRSPAPPWNTWPVAAPTAAGRRRGPARTVRTSTRRRWPRARFAIYRSVRESIGAVPGLFVQLTALSLSPPPTFFLSISLSPPNHPTNQPPTQPTRHDRRFARFNTENGTLGKEINRIRLIRFRLCCQDSILINVMSKLSYMKRNLIDELEANSAVMQSSYQVSSW